MPIDEFAVHDPFENHPLFKTEEDARKEEEETGEHPAVALAMPEDTLTMAAVAVADETRPLGWMETQTDPEFRWE